ncbi:hypothetical protein [Ciceribacter ferrooxidans]|uniref:hypothetical protein n=1 Tax=Ciceribacter ferrooxidans TaxID=2509717 RepID=UPI0013EA3299|nr:hypothetical protein [Ciceribacter ferrooxidans]
MFLLMKEERQSCAVKVNRIEEKAVGAKPPTVEKACESGEIRLAIPRDMAAFPPGE